MTILSIDDSKSVHLFIKICLASIKTIKLIDLYDGQEALAFLKTTSEKIDLILLDWEMPIQSGPETVKILVENKIDIPIIMVTSKNEILEISQMLQSGVKDYIMKPFTPDILIEKIENALNIQLQK